MLKLFYLVFVFLLLFQPLIAQGVSLALQNFGSQNLGGSGVVINEIAWMGTSTPANDEWLELYNPTDSVVNLEGWILKAVDGTPEINLSGTISANGFFFIRKN